MAASLSDMTNDLNEQPYDSSYDHIMRSLLPKLPDFLIIGNLPDIRNSPIWENPIRHDLSYFLLPGRTPFRDLLDIRFNIIHGSVPVFESDFMNFWLQLDDFHKERRLLLNYFSIKRDVPEIIERHQMKNRLQRFLVDDVMCENLSTLHRLFITEQKKLGTNGFPGIVNRFMASFVYHCSIELGKCMRQFFLRPNKTIAFRNYPREGFDAAPWIRNDALNNMTHEMVTTVFISFLAVQAIWKAKSDVKAKRKYLKKLKVSVVHWRNEDRQFLLDAIETNGESCRGTYVERLLRRVGLENFKVIAFGKEKFCSSCGRSSNIKRLLCCRRCVEEKVRPKARYCDENCQRADWVMHKSNVHSREKKRSE